MAHHDPISTPTPAESDLTRKFNENPEWTPERLIGELKRLLQVAVEIELSTIPVYLYSYYSIQRAPQLLPGQEDVALFANKAGGVIMSVAVEEMLHMSLSANILYAIGGTPEIYLRSPGTPPATYPTNLPGHARKGPDDKPMSIPLAKFSFEQLWHFLEIEYPEKRDAPPENQNWKTIGQIYAYIRSIIASKKLIDQHFQVGAKLQQIQPDNYSPNNIDTVYPSHAFDKLDPPSSPESAARAAKFASRDDSHAGMAQLLAINSKNDALAAITTICDQGEGLRVHDEATGVDDPSHHENSHYMKFLRLQAQLEGYAPKQECLPAFPPAPNPITPTIRTNELQYFVANYPDNPYTVDYPADLKPWSDLCNGVYQYMLILTETIFRVPPGLQKQFFNQSMHMSMIWVLDKMVQDMRTYLTYEKNGVKYALAPTFENIYLGARHEAYDRLCDLITATQSGRACPQMEYLFERIQSLPDVRIYWESAPPKQAPSGNIDPVVAEKFKGVPKFPANPPTYFALPAGAERHACMGLNACKGQDRFGLQGHEDPKSPGHYVQNSCAGQGYCSTALNYLGEASDHSCHVMNGCKHQGGCGLYGTAHEQSRPGFNSCKSLGSCATPINAERFSTEGVNRGKSVWLRARAHFAEHEWPKLREKDPSLPAAPPPIPGSVTDPEVFAGGPSHEWIAVYSGEDVTACGASKMSGAGSCS